MGYSEKEVGGVKLAGKKIIALGERDGVPADAISRCMQSAGAEVVLAETECYV